MDELRSLARERNLRGYSRLRKADLINLLRTHTYLFYVSPDATLGADNQTEPKPLTKRQIKRRRNKASKLSKRTKNLRIEIDDLKSQMDNIEDKIAKASSSTSARFKRKKIRSMKREDTKIAEKIKEQTEKLE